ncbi:MAG TPA: LysR substrate-binding domain-containing protein [Acidobacteriaceae bacterium]|nr:LysR substrate-binding domain-containing protein [Acidobacteriaceae bacterium]
MDFAQLETLLAVAEEKGFSRAAARLRRTQPAVSQMIRKLESDLGEVLFERSSREATLTAAGEVLSGYARRLMKLRAEAESAIQELRNLERGRLQLAANEYTCLYLLRVLDRFQQLCPQIGVTVHRSLASRIPEEILDRTVEIGVLSFHPEGEQLKTIAVYTDELALVVSPQHPLAREKRVAIEDLGAENFIAHNVPSPLRRQVIAAFAKHKTPLNMGVELPSLEAIKRFVALGNGVALVPGLTVEHEIQIGELMKVPVEALRFERHIRLVHRRQATLSHAAAAFLKVVRALAAEVGSPFEFRIERAG